MYIIFLQQNKTGGEKNTCLDKCIINRIFLIFKVYTAHKELYSLDI